MENDKFRMVVDTILVKEFYDYNKKILTSEFNDNDPFDVEKDYENDIEVLFSDDAYNGQKITLEIRISNYLRPSNPEDMEEIPYILVLNSVSKEYYLFHRSLKAYNSVEDNFFAEKVQIYNNIIGGYGLVAGYSSSNYCINSLK